MLLNEVIGNSSLTDYEKELIGSQTVTITPVRTSVHLYNIDVIREYIDYFYTSVFMNPIYLQENWIDYQNATFNVTGILLASVDPLNINLENLIVDAYGLRNGIVFRTV